MIGRAKRAARVGRKEANVEVGKAPLANLCTDVSRSLPTYGGRRREMVAR